MASLSQVPQILTKSSLAYGIQYFKWIIPLPTIFFFLKMVDKMLGETNQVGDSA